MHWPMRGNHSFLPSRRIPVNGGRGRTAGIGTSFSSLTAELGTQALGPVLAWQGSCVNVSTSRFISLEHWVSCSTHTHHLPQPPLPVPVCLSHQSTLRCPTPKPSPRSYEPRGRAERRLSPLGLNGWEQRRCPMPETR